MNWHWFIEKPKTGREAVIVNIVRLVIVLALAAACFVFISAQNPSHAQPQHATTQRFVPPHDPGPDTWATLAAMKWNHHKPNLHKSGGRRVPHKAVVKLERYRTNHPSVRPWWKRGLDLGQCMFNSIGSPPWTMTWQSLCLTIGENPTFRHINEQITAVRVLCGGAAVAGFLKGGGEWGAVKASAKCAFPAAVAIYENWLGRRAHTRTHTRAGAR